MNDVKTFLCMKYNDQFGIEQNIEYGKTKPFYK